MTTVNTTSSEKSKLVEIWVGPDLAVLTKSQYKVLRSQIKRFGAETVQKCFFDYYEGSLADMHKDSVFKCHVDTLNQIERYLGV